MSEALHGTGGGRLSWYVNRLRCMSAPEIPHRITRAVKARAEAAGLRPLRVPAPRFDARGVRFVHCSKRVDAESCLRAAEGIVAGRFDLFALRDRRLGNPPRWNRDPKTGIEPPSGFGKLLQYRDPALVGDIKYLWELNRHQHLVTLAQAHALCGEPRYTDCLQRHLDSWFRDCPCGHGANWASALEAALRLINWSLAWQLLGGASARLFAGPDGAAFRDRWLRSVFQHARFVRGFLSLHSSANNHLIGEAAGLFIAAATWPCWKRMARWREQAAAVLERELRRQNTEDGVNREQAVSYQQFELDLLLLAWLAAANLGRPFSRGYAKRMEAMINFLASIADLAGNVPMIGDADDGYAVRLSREPDFCRYRSLFATGAILFRRKDLRRKAVVLDDKTRWLFGDNAEREWRIAGAAGGERPRRQAFPAGGYYVLGTGLETPNEIRVVVDAGPVGYPSIAAHGHADALSFTLSVGGSEFLVDPGTYTYYADDRWRRYFRGTSAHNTVRVDASCQSVSGGNFMWLKKARAECTNWWQTAAADVFTGRHDGYRRLSDPVVHERRIELLKAERRLRIIDTLHMAGEHEIELFFHCSQGCVPETAPGGQGILLHCGARTLRLVPPQRRGVRPSVVRGSEEPILGWISRRFDHREPCPTVVWRATLCGTSELRTEIFC